MANEITVSFQLSATKGSLKVYEPNISTRVDMDGTHTYSKVFDISGTDILLTIPTDWPWGVGWCQFVNLSDEDDCALSTGHLGAFTAQEFCNLKPGETAQFPAGMNGIYARSSNEYGGFHELQVRALER